MQLKAPDPPHSESLKSKDTGFGSLDSPDELVDIRKIVAQSVVARLKGKRFGGDDETAEVSNSKSEDLLLVTPEKAKPASRWRRKTFSAKSRRQKRTLPSPLETGDAVVQDGKQLDDPSMASKTRSNSTLSPSGSKQALPSSEGDRQLAAAFLPVLSELKFDSRAMSGTHSSCDHSQSSPISRVGIVGSAPVTCFESSSFLDQADVVRDTVSDDVHADATTDGNTVPHDEIAAEQTPSRLTVAGRRKVSSFPKHLALPSAPSSPSTSIRSLPPQFMEANQEEVSSGGVREEVSSGGVPETQGGSDSTDSRAQNQQCSIAMRTPTSAQVSPQWSSCENVAIEPPQPARAARTLVQSDKLQSSSTSSLTGWSTIRRLTFSKKANSSRVVELRAKHSLGHAECVQRRERGLSKLGVAVGKGHRKVEESRQNACGK